MPPSCCGLLCTAHVPRPHIRELGELVKADSSTSDVVPGPDRPLERERCFSMPNGVQRSVQ